MCAGDFEPDTLVFADGQVDRSPTGSGVQARVALAYAKGSRRLNESFTYHSPVSKAFGGQGAFVGEALEEVDVGLKDLRGVIVKVSGWAHYTGTSNFVVEEGDGVGAGFWWDEVMPSKGLKHVNRPSLRERLKLKSGEY